MSYGISYGRNTLWATVVRAHNLRARIFRAPSDTFPKLKSELILPSDSLLDDSYLQCPECAGNPCCDVTIKEVYGHDQDLGWLVFQRLLLVVVTKKGYVGTLGLRLPQALVLANLGLAGIVAVATPLVNLRAHLLHSPPACLDDGGLVLVILGALGGLLLFLYELWTVRRGFQA